MDNFPYLLSSLPYLSVAFWTALAVSAILTKPVLATLLRLNSRQTVSAYAPETHQKKQGTPTMGGLIIVGGTLAAMAVGPYRDWAALVLFAGFTLIGFIDDFVVPRRFVGKRGLGWRQKILMQIVVATGAAFMARGAPLGIGVLIFSVLFFSNAYNFSDGLDGLAGTLLLGLGVGLLAMGLLGTMRVEWLVPLAALVGGAIPFLFVNAPPAKVFMGDVGSLPIGALLGYVVGQFVLGRYLNGIHYHVPLGPVTVASVMMIVELVPGPLQILSVKVRKKKIFPYTPIHHAFEKAGWAETRVVFHFALAQLLLSALAVGLMVGLPALPNSAPTHVVRR